MGVIGAILGDIIGSRYERHKCKTPKSVDLFTVENRFTDDTVLTVAIADYLVHRDNWKNIDEALRHYTIQYPHRGYGGGYRKWVFNDPSFMPSFGNGSAMRISAVADYAADEEELKKLVKEVTEPTHNTEEGMKGALVIATCAYMAKHGETKKKILEFASQYYPEIKNTKYNKLDYPWSATCQLSVPLAVRCFYDSNSYEDCMRKVISINCDGDTVCAMSGAIAENYYGKTVDNYEEYLKYYLNGQMLETIKELQDARREQA